jgi:type I restriction-modification system DNA methylase subunit
METVIEKIRGIMRKEGVTGMDSINHCIIFVIARMLDKEKCKKFGINEKNSYYNIMHDEDGDFIGAQELYGRIYTKNDTSCLVGQIVNKLKFSNIKFKLESPQHVEQIMKELEKLDMTKLETKYDIIGTIYEYHLKSGTSNAMRDLGQYYTNRSVIEFMIKMCDIKMNKKGEIETIIDPTMGTGGFLTMSVKYLNDKYKNKIDWGINKSRIYGFDIDENVKNMALLNMLLECGEMCEDTFIRNDTLYYDFKLKNDEILNKVDVILANEPMGIKNIIHTSCCDRIKQLNIKGTKAEPLFLQLFMQSLNDGGRCAVIVPDGVLFNDSNLHNDTRKYLVENLNLKKVISLNDDFFLNTGVKTSILFFINNGKTSEVEFSELKLNKKGLIENSIIKVNYKKIKEMNYSLFVNKYNSKEIVKIEGVEYKKLGDVCEIKFGKRIKKDEVEVNKDYNGVRYPCYGGGDISFYMKEYNREDKNLVISRFALSKCCVRIINNKFWLNDSGFTLHTKNNKLMMQDYLNYIMLNKQEEIYNLSAGACQKNIVMDDFNKLEIPIPSMEVQQKIVEQLDVIYKNIQTCKEQIDESKKIMKYYVETMTLWDKEQKLGEITEIKFGKRIKKDEVEIDINYNGIKYPCYGGGDISFYMKEYNREDRNLVISRFALSKCCVRIVNDKFWLNDSGFTLHTMSKLLIQNFLNYIMLQKQDEIYNISAGACQKNININDFKNINIKVPSLEKQKEIVSYCEEIDNIIKSMELRIKSNEILMKNIMDTYLKSNNKKNKSHKELSESSKLSELSESKSNKSESDSSSESEKEIKPKKIIKKQSKKSESISSSESEEEIKPKKIIKKQSKNASESDSSNESEEEIKPKKNNKKTIK